MLTLESDQKERLLMAEEKSIEDIIERLETLERLVTKMFRGLVLKEDFTINPGEWKVDK